MLYGSIEAGGTKFVCAVGDENYQTQDVIQFPTTTPQETIQKAIDYFKKFKIVALSVGSFGPIETINTATKYGYITNTPKMYWKDTNFVGTLKRQLNIPIYWTTDVNSSAFGEYLINDKVNSLVYYTVGTGVGAGIVIDGQLIGEKGHPEMGHVFLKRHVEDTDFEGICPFHKDCLEGLVSGPTFDARLGISGELVQKENPIWNIMAYYLAQAAIQTTLIIRPEKIIFGGGVISEQFLKKVRYHFGQLLNSYVEVPNLDKYIVMTAVKNNGSATLGNFALADRLFRTNEDF